jgi:hypothetical protein
MFGRSRRAKQSPSPQDDPNSIGNIAVERGYITRFELDEAMRAQQARLPLGEILIEMGKLTRHELEELLFEQKIRRGEVKDREEIIRFERRKSRTRIRLMQDGFKEVRDDVRKLATTVMAASVRASGK